MSSDFPVLSLGQQYAVVCALSKAHDQGGTSCVYCVKLQIGSAIENNQWPIHASGNPFRLLKNCWSYIWRNDDLQVSKIDFGSVIIVDQLKKFVANTEEVMTIHKVLSHLQFGDGEHGRAYRGIREAFPEAVIAPSGFKGICQNNGKKPYPTFALISIEKASTIDGRIVIQTRLGEEINLNNRSRVCLYSGIGKKDLPVRKPKSENDVCDVILIGFGSRPTLEGKYYAVCEGVLLSVVSEQIWSQTEAMAQAVHDPVLSGANHGQLSERNLSQVNVPPAYEPHVFVVNPTDPNKLPPHIHPDSKDVYPMKSKPRGIALIINNERFSQSEKENLENRPGSEKDVQALTMLFEELYFNVIIKRNMGGENILHFLNKYAQEDHSAYDCFVLCIMSHGLKGEFFGSDGVTLPFEKVRDIFSNSNCRTLKGKPKLVFIQACRGHHIQTGVVNDSPFPEPQPLATAASAKFEDWNFKFKETLPDHSDILMAYSTVDGYVSFRDQCSGSRFIRSLVEIFKEKAGHEDVLSMLTMVNDMLIKLGDIGSKQVGQPTSTLTKKLFFWPGL